MLSSFINRQGLSGLLLILVVSTIDSQNYIVLRYIKYMNFMKNFKEYNL